MLFFIRPDGYMMLCVWILLSYIFPQKVHTSAYPDSQETLSLLDTPWSVLSMKGVRKLGHFLFDLWLKKIGVVSVTFLLLIIPPVLQFAVISNMIRDNFQLMCCFSHYQFYQLKITTYLCGTSSSPRNQYVQIKWPYAYLRDISTSGPTLPKPSFTS